MFAGTLTPRQSQCQSRRLVVPALGAFEPGGHYHTRKQSWCSSNHTGHTGRRVRFSPSSLIFGQKSERLGLLSSASAGWWFGCQLPLAQRLIQLSPPGKRLSASIPAMASPTEYCRIGL